MNICIVIIEKIKYRLPFLLNIQEHSIYRPPLWELII